MARAKKVAARTARKIADATAVAHARSISTKLNVHTSDTDECKCKTYLEGDVKGYTMCVGCYQMAVTNGTLTVELWIGDVTLARVHGIPCGVVPVERVTSWLRRRRKLIEPADGLVGVHYDCLDERMRMVERRLCDCPRK